MKRTRHDTTDLGMDTAISRRDFVNGVLVGSGAALLAGPAAALAGAPADALSPSGSAWTGYGGVGDYRWSNGNTEAVRDAAHGIRDHLYPETAGLKVDEAVDLVVVGGGFSGVTAAFEFNKRRKPNQTCLLLENHPMLGGEAKQNEFEVDGRRLVAPQGSNGALVVKPQDQITGRYETYAQYYRELEMPAHYELEPLAGGAEKYQLPNDHFDPMMLEKRFATGYYFPGSGWARNPAAAHFANTPWPAAVQKDLDDFVNNRRDVISGQPDADRWLDSMSYYDLLDKLRYGPEVKRYIDPLLGVGNFGVCGNAISAFAAKRLTLPGTIPSDTPNRFDGIEVVSFPGGNAVFLRRMLERMLPGALSGDGSLPSTAQGAVNFSRLDRAGSPVRIRLSSTVIRIRHDGAPAFGGLRDRHVCAGRQAPPCESEGRSAGLGRLGEPQYRGRPAASLFAGLLAVQIWAGAHPERRGAPLAFLRLARVRGGTLVLGPGLARVRAPQCGVREECAAAHARQPHRPDVLHSAAERGGGSLDTGQRRARSTARAILCRLRAADPRADDRDVRRCRLRCAARYRRHRPEQMGSRLLRAAGRAISSAGTGSRHPTR